MKVRNQKGFTLIELLIVVAINLVGDQVRNVLNPRRSR